MEDLFAIRGNIIEPMDWEQPLADAVGISFDLMRFVVSFFLSVPIGAGIRSFKSPTARNFYALITGIALVYYPFGNGVVHAVPPALLTYLGLLIAPKYAGYITWAVCFPYLIAMHVSNASGANWGRGKLDFTGGEMVMVLKLVAMGMCFQDDKTIKPEEMTSYQAEKRIQKPPNLLEYFGFIFCMGNLLAGPFFELKDYQDFIHFRGLWDPKAAKPMPSPLRPGLIVLVTSLFFLGLYMVGDAYYPTTLLLDPNFGALPFGYKLWLMYAITTIYRYKYFFAWGLSETSLTFAGLSYEGYGEDGKPHWKRCSNALPFTTEMCDSARRLPVGWNTCTGVFLRRYVYERLTPKGRKPTFVTMLGTQMVAGVWHGLYPGYIMFFISTAILFHGSSVLYKIEQVYLKPIAHNPIWTAIKIAITMETLGYIATAFLILDATQANRVWASVYYLPHIYMISLYVLEAIIPLKPKRSKEDKQAKAE